MIKDWEAAEKPSPASDPESGELGQFAAVRFVTYDPTTAVLQLVTRATDPVTVPAVSTVTVRWQDGDWRYEVSSTLGASQTIPSIAGYAQWGSV